MTSSMEATIAEDFGKARGDALSRNDPSCLFESLLSFGEELKPHMVSDGLLLEIWSEVQERVVDLLDTQKRWGSQLFGLGKSFQTIEYIQFRDLVCAQWHNQHKSKTVYMRCLIFCCRRTESLVSSCTSSIGTVSFLSRFVDLQLSPF